MLTLTDGETCYAITGAGDLIGGMSSSYECKDGEIGGTPNRGTSYWTVYYQHGGSDVLTTKMVLAAYR